MDGTNKIFASCTDHRHGVGVLVDSLRPMRWILDLLTYWILASVACSFQIASPQQSPHPRRLFLFNKLFEESGSLGKGITVGKVQVALISQDRSRNSIFGILEQKATALSSSSSSSQLAQLASEVCLAVLRKSDDWMGACSASQWFSQNDYTKAESLFNEWANREAFKFEKVGHCFMCRFVTSKSATRHNSRPVCRLVGVHSRRRQ